MNDIFTNATWEKANGIKTTIPQRDRIRELANVDGKDEYDRSVLELLDDFAALKVLIAAQADKLARVEKQTST